MSEDNETCFEIMPQPKINTSWYLSVEAKTIKFLDNERIWTQDVKPLNRTKTWTMKMVNIYNSVQIKTICFSKFIINNMKIQATDYEEHVHFLLKKNI